MSGGDWKAMFKAVQDGDLELVKTYIRIGIDLNYQHPEFMALPLVESIRYNHLEITKLLLGKGANPTLKEIAEGETALLVAEKNKNKKAIELIESYIV
jgi:ankyrin repeat protein